MIVRQTRLVQFYRGAKLLVMEVADIIKEAHIIGEESTFAEALTKMIRSQTNTLLVVDEEGKLTGELSVADFLDAVVPMDVDGDDVLEHFASEDQFEAAIKEARDTPVSLFMSYDFDTVGIHDGLFEVAATAVSRQRARIPVIDKEGRPVGIISRQGLKHILGDFLNIKDKA